MTFKELASLLFWTLGFTMGLFLYILLCIPRTHADSTWTAETQKKLDAMISIGWKPDTAKQSIIECKALSTDPGACVQVSNFI